MNVEVQSTVKWTPIYIHIDTEYVLKWKQVCYHEELYFRVYFIFSKPPSVTVQWGQLPQYQFPLFISC